MLNIIILWNGLNSTRGHGIHWTHFCLFPDRPFFCGCGKAAATFPVEVNHHLPPVSHSSWALCRWALLSWACPFSICLGEGRRCLMLLFSASLRKSSFGLAAHWGRKPSCLPSFGFRPVCPFRSSLNQLNQACKYLGSGNSNPFASFLTCPPLWLLFQPNQKT